MKLRVALLLSLLAIVPALAGEQPRPISKFDQFGVVGHCDLTARLDNFAIQLQHESETTGHIVAYGPEGEGLGTGKHFLKLMKDYLVNTRGLPKRRVNTIYAGSYQVLNEPRIE